MAQYIAHQIISYPELREKYEEACFLANQVDEVLWVDNSELMLEIAEPFLDRLFDTAKDLSKLARVPLTVKGIKAGAKYWRRDQQKLAELSCVVRLLKFNNYPYEEKDVAHELNKLTQSESGIPSATRSQRDDRSVQRGIQRLLKRNDVTWPEFVERALKGEFPSR